MAVILNMFGFDSSAPINCQVRIIFPGFSYARVNPNYLGKVWVIFEVVSHPLLMKNDV
jgi:hypothetical protein